MAHTLIVNSGRNTEQSFQNPSSSKISQAIDGLIPAIYHFVILEADPPSEKCTYIQTLIEREGKAKGQYLVEARYIFDGYFKHYKKEFGSPDEVKKVFQSFADGTAPNTAGWEDITENLIAATG